MGRTHVWLVLVGFLLACYAVSGISAFFTAPQIHGWYATLRQPRITPPNWVFGPVWTTLYTLMAVAAWMAWRLPDSPQRTLALQFFWAQLALNFAWSFLFFNRHWVLAAGIEILLLWGAILGMTLAYARISRAAMWLSVPYAAWVGFASILNWGVWWLNRE